MKLPIIPKVTVDLPDELVSEFGRYYFPLREVSIGIFVFSMQRESKKELVRLCNEDPPDTEKIQELCIQELQHCIDLATNQT